MGEQENFFLQRLEDHGHWQGEVFHFDEPQTVATEDGQTIQIKQLNCAGMVLQDGISREDVVTAVLNPLGVAERAD